MGSNYVCIKRGSYIARWQSSKFISLAFTFIQFRAKETLSCYCFKVRPFRFMLRFRGFTVLFWFTRIKEMGREQFKRSKVCFRMDVSRCRPGQRASKMIWRIPFIQNVCKHLFPNPDEILTRNCVDKPSSCFLVLFRWLRIVFITKAFSNNGQQFRKSIQVFLGY